MIHKQERCVTVVGSLTNYNADQLAGSFEVLKMFFLIKVKTGKRSRLLRLVHNSPIGGENKRSSCSKT